MIKQFPDTLLFLLKSQWKMVICRRGSIRYVKKLLTQKAGDFIIKCLLILFYTILCNELLLIFFELDFTIINWTTDTKNCRKIQKCYNSCIPQSGGIAILNSFYAKPINLFNPVLTTEYKFSLVVKT